jgi:Domain of unknown function (DUF5666)
MDIKTFYHSKDFRYVLIALVVVIFLILAFQVGETVGIRRAEFGNRFGDNYMHAFGEEGRPFGYGASGRVVSVSGNTFTVALPDQSERMVSIEPTTLIRELRNSASTSNLAVDDSVIVIGSPTSNGVIDARLVRIISTTTSPM